MCAACALRAHIWCPRFGRRGQLLKGSSELVSAADLRKTHYLPGACTRFSLLPLGACLNEASCFAASRSEFDRFLNWARYVICKTLKETFTYVTQTKRNAFCFDFCCGSGPRGVIMFFCSPPQTSKAPLPPVPAALPWQRCFELITLSLALSLPLTRSDTRTPRFAC